MHPISGLFAVVYLSIGSLRKEELAWQSNLQSWRFVSESARATAFYEEAAELRQSALKELERAEREIEIADEERKEAAALQENADRDASEAADAKAESDSKAAQAEADTAVAARDEALADAAEEQATEAAEAAAEELGEGEEAEVADASIFWIPGFDIVGQVLADALLASAATEAAISAERAATAAAEHSRAADESAAAEEAAAEGEAAAALAKEKGTSASREEEESQELQVDADKHEKEAGDAESLEQSKTAEADAAEASGAKHTKASELALSRAVRLRLQLLFVFLSSLFCVTLSPAFSLVSFILSYHSTASVASTSTPWVPQAEWSGAYTAAKLGSGIGLVVGFFTRQFFSRAVTRESDHAAVDSAHEGESHADTVIQLLYGFGMMICGAALCIIFSYLIHRNNWWNSRKNMRKHHGIAAFVFAEVDTIENDLELLGIGFLCLLALREWMNGWIIVQEGLWALHLLPSSLYNFLMSSTESMVWLALLFIGVVSILGWASLQVWKYCYRCSFGSTSCQALNPQSETFPDANASCYTEEEERFETANHRDRRAEGSVIYAAMHIIVFALTLWIALPVFSRALFAISDHHAGPMPSLALAAGPLKNCSFCSHFTRANANATAATTAAAQSANIASVSAARNLCGNLASTDTTGDGCSSSGSENIAIIFSGGINEVLNEVIGSRVASRRLRALLSSVAYSSSSESDINADHSFPAHGISAQNKVFMKVEIALHVVFWGSLLVGFLIGALQVAIVITAVHSPEMVRESFSGIDNRSSSARSDSPALAVSNGFNKTYSSLATGSNQAKNEAVGDKGATVADVTQRSTSAQPFASRSGTSCNCHAESESSFVVETDPLLGVNRCERSTLRAVRDISLCHESMLVFWGSFWRVTLCIFLLCVIGLVFCMPLFHFLPVLRTLSRWTWQVGGYILLGSLSIFMSYFAPYGVFPDMV